MDAPHRTTLCDGVGRQRRRPQRRPFRQSLFLRAAGGPRGCYDLRFPVWCRCRSDYDAILCVASWPAPRREVWRTLLRARAIENQCYVGGVNRTGDDPWNHYAGDSAVVDFKGTPLCEADASEGVFTARLDREALDRFRTKFPAWRDADDFLLR